MFGFGKMQLKDRALAHLVTPEIEQLVASIPKPVGSFGYDPWGYNEEHFRPPSACASCSTRNISG
jgi:hypothetical protein